MERIFTIILALGFAAFWQSTSRGVGTASIDVPFPEHFVQSDLSEADVLWNLDGNRCQFNCTQKGPSNVGFHVSSFIFVASGAAAPELELYSDGRGRAKTSASFITTSGGYDVYSASLKTQCVGGSQNGAQCNQNANCPGGRCAACNHAGSCSDRPALGPCQNVCVGGSNDGGMCSVGSNCPGGICAAPFAGLAATCYLLSGCSTSPSGDPLETGCVQDCSTSGASDTGTAGDPFEDGPFHSAFARVTSVFGGNPVVISSEDVIYQIRKTTSGQGSMCQGSFEDF